MLIASVKSNKYPSLNELNDTPYIGSTLIACLAMLPMFLMHELVQQIFGRSVVFDLSVTFFLNNLIFHIFLIYVFDIRIKIFYIPSTLFCVFCVILNGFREYDKILSIVNS